MTERYQRTLEGVYAAEGGDIDQEYKEPTDFHGKREGYLGKPREQWHPYDRKSGTGRGRELPKSGHGKGNWGNLGDELKNIDLNDEASFPTLIKEAPH
jgi:hypothetical protein